ncbi:glycosyltransferase family 4 protein [Coriobacteriia bacterium Es71-Z0120]|uniref:glycosyltransferase family 4 protein n=1 Tax=Parvivirga hydrogeniphila TaxID=2939460 RepID=UPI002260D472|nr:glycosyltransferase family 4 protein [Parvivirga hydrogeniphila]MCL4079341.1 glycosyltransferase family 4 protein [Parvivirga hydrogeniphila]
MTSLSGITLVFVTSHAGRTLGRIERRWLRVMETLLAHGAHVHLVCALRAPVEGEARARGVTVAPYRLDRFNLVRTRSRLRKYLLRYRPAIVHTTGYEADVVTRWAASDLPVAIVSSATCSSWPPRGTGVFDTWIRQRLDRDTLPRLDAFVVDAPEMAERAVAAGVPRDRVVLDPPSVRIARVLEEADVDVELPDGCPLVGYAGALSRSRGLMALAAIAPRIKAQHPGACVVVAGEGLARHTLHAAVRDGRIDLVAPVPSVPAVLARLDVCVFPLAEPGVPTPLLEALALGRPTVVTAVPGVAGLLDDGVEALVVPTRDTDALADAVLRLLADPAFASAAGERGRLAAIDRFQAADSVERHLALYRRLAAGRA